MTIGNIVTTDARPSSDIMKKKKITTITFLLILLTVLSLKSMNPQCIPQHFIKIQTMLRWSLLVFTDKLARFDLFILRFGAVVLMPSFRPSNQYSYNLLRLLELVLRTTSLPTFEMIQMVTVLSICVWEGLMSFICLELRMTVFRPKQFFLTIAYLIWQ